MVILCLKKPQQKQKKPQFFSWNKFLTVLLKAPINNIGEVRMSCDIVYNRNGIAQPKYGINIFYLCEVHPHYSSKLFDVTVQVNYCVFVYTCLLKSCVDLKHICKMNSVVPATSHRAIS